MMANTGFYCEVCKRNFTSEFYFNSHMQGRPHAAVVKEKQAEKEAAVVKLGDIQQAKHQQPCLVLWYCGKCTSHSRMFRKEHEKGVDVTIPLCPDCDVLNKSINKICCG